MSATTGERWGNVASITLFATGRIGAGSRAVVRPFLSPGTVSKAR